MSWFNRITLALVIAVNAVMILLVVGASTMWLQWRGVLLFLPFLALEILRCALIARRNRSTANRKTDYPPPSALILRSISSFSLGSNSATLAYASFAAAALPSSA